MFKDKSYLLIISVLILAISIFVSANMLKDGLEAIRVYVPGSLTVHNVDSNNYFNLMTLEQAAYYLGIEQRTLIQIVTTDEMELPYLRVDGKYIFSKDAIDQWLLKTRLTVN